MIEFILRRAFWLIPVIIVVAAVTFALMFRAPGGPWDLEKPMPPAAIEQLNARFGLDKPVWLNEDGLSEAFDDGVECALVGGEKPGSVTHRFW